jgi:DNA-binding NarL/FixJ family response regulator
MSEPMSGKVLVAVSDLLFGSKIDAAARVAGVEVVRAPRDAPLADAVHDLAPAAVLADLGRDGMVEALASLRRAHPDVRVLGFAGHLREDLLSAARAAGVAVFTRGELSARLAQVLRDAAG